MKIALPRRRRFTRVDDDPPAAVVPLLPQEFIQDRKRLGAICTGKYQDLGERNIAPGIGGAVDAERFVISGRSRHHAKTPIVIDIPRSQTRAGKLAHQIGFFGRQGGS